MKISYINDEFFSRLETLSLELSPDLAGFFGGKHKTRSYGQTVEFSDYREYMLGDDIRRIDWNLYSRFEKHYLKLFTDERQMHVQIFMDCSASMGNDPAKGAFAVGVGAALGFLAVHNMDKVSFRLMKGNVAQDLSVGTIVGKTTFFGAMNELENINFTGDTSISEAVMNCTDTGSKDGLTVIISDFFTESDWKKAVNYLRHKKRQVLLVQVMSRDEVDPAYMGRMNLIDSEAADMADVKNMKIRITKGMQMAYMDAMNDLIADLKTFCRSRGVDFISTVSDKAIEKLIFGELLRTGIMV